MSRALVLQQVTFRELWHTSRALEPAAVDLAMDNRTEEDLAALEDNLPRRAASARRAAVAELDAEFHKLIGKATHNRVLQLAKEPSSMLVRPTTALIISNNPGGIPRLIEAHAHILDALKRRDREKGGCRSTGICATGRPASSVPAAISTARSMLIKLGRPRSLRSSRTDRSAARHDATAPRRAPAAPLVARRHRLEQRPYQHHWKRR